MSEASPRGTYLVIAEALREGVVNGQIVDALPSEADLMRSHGVARNTIRRALKFLEAEGVLQSVPGVGWRVAKPGDRKTPLSRLPPRSRSLDGHGTD